MQGPDQRQLAIEQEVRLVSRARGGDELAFRDLWKTAERRVYGLCLHLTGQHADALDAMQETQLAAWRHLDRFEARSPFVLWATAIARNAALGIVRSRARRPETTVETIPEPAPTGGFEDELAQFSEIRGMLSRLRGEHREALLLWAAGMTHAQVASTMKVPVETARVWVFRARRDMRAALEAAG